MASLIQERQGVGFTEGPIYRVPLGRCVACLVQFPVAALTIESIIHYDTYAGKALGPQDLVNMHNDTSNLTFLCKGCHASKDLEPSTLYDWIMETVRLEEHGTRLSQVQVVRQAWLDMERVAAQQFLHMDLTGLQHVLADPNLSPRSQAAARMARISLAGQKALNDAHFLFDFHLAKDVELLAHQLEAEAKLHLQPGKSKPVP
ncbi:MAG: HNH endonuclease [Hyalangium sp.]|uniref:HNH endonuclease n=1 Tax=Hyalangium sp. TaxID=2028555 RepID=UPI003899DA35